MEIVLALHHEERVLEMIRAPQPTALRRLGKGIVACDVHGGHSGHIREIIPQLQARGSHYRVSLVRTGIVALVARMTHAELVHHRRGDHVRIGEYLQVVVAPLGGDPNQWIVAVPPAGGDASLDQDAEKE